MYDRQEIYLNGAWTTCSTGVFIEVVNPATEEVMGQIPSCGETDVKWAVAAARDAFEGWGRMPVELRLSFLRKIHEGMVARSEEIAQTITAELGIPIKLSRRIQAGLPIAVMESYVKLLGEYPFEERIGNSLVLKEPAGVAACITPWNYPLHQVIAKVAPALAAGCTIVLKPSEVVPLSAFILAEIIHEAGLPAGVFNLVSGYGEPVGEAMASHPGVDLISFTGSVRAGLSVSNLAAATLKRVALELGGKSAAIILDDADLAAAVKGTAASSFVNSGQTCSAHTRMLVPESLYDQAAALAVEVAATYVPGDPLSEQTRLGPLVSARQRERVLDYIRKGVNEGAELLCGGTEPPEGLEQGYYARPTVFGRVTPDMTIAREEIFGPVLSIMTYRDEDDAVRLANDTIYGLAGGVWSGEVKRAEGVARRLRTGQVEINGGAFNILAPFGGYKQSGHGRELGKYGLEEFLEIKSIQFK
ncbi:aldehyde dehydrogenase family protein [Geobacter grbiciae]|uniref:aldehyde dehydrogenase family protein n=1 Tax=Geobacter grbiciae TaxID=155042 RepID=UPI001C00B954|nr:aldehyde dehydrogenase family protein [Geobacter grbiciae]MBT1076467.1 aldehyde dehydrogenase family protein [Geobacter grbiciae]